MIRKEHGFIELGCLFMVVMIAALVFFAFAAGSKGTVKLGGPGCSNSSSQDVVELLKEKNVGVNFSDWSEEDQALYNRALHQMLERKEKNVVGTSSSTRNSL